MSLPMIWGEDEPRARMSDADTSHKAADSNDISRSRNEVVWLLTSSGPMADHELVIAHDLDYQWSEPGWHHFTPQRIRTARHELTRDGAVEFTGLYRLTPSGRRAQVWAMAK